MNLDDKTLLDNERVWVRRIVVAPGGRVELPDCGAGALLVVIKGGKVISLRGRISIWPAGRVVWLSGSDPSPAGRLNEGPASLEFVHVAVKVLATPDTMAGREPSERLYLNYPNIAGEDLLENDQVIVQRFMVRPGEWEGVHEHVPHMLYIHVTGGHWSARSLRDGEHAYDDASPDGSVGWMPTIALSKGHESGNVGPRPIDLIWVTFKN